MNDDAACQLLTLGDCLSLSVSVSVSVSVSLPHLMQASFSAPKTFGYCGPKLAEQRGSEPVGWLAGCSYSLASSTVLQLGLLVGRPLVSV